MTAPLSALDHIVVGARDLDAAHKTWRGLGFTLTPRGAHDGGATANHCLMFGESYLELLAPTGAGTSALASAVGARGDGGLGLAFKSDDATATAHALRDAGVTAHDPVALSRPLQLDGTTHRVAFENVMFEGNLPGLFTFACRHATPELTRARHEWQLHANTATGIEEIVLRAADPAIYRKPLEALFGFARVADGPHGINVVLENLGLAVMTDVGLRERFGTKALTGLPAAPIIAAVSFRVSEADAAGAMLDMGRVSYDDHHSGLVVPAAVAGGVIVEFTDD
ncbi:MAG: VOC family protein [Alphaproteobacteria bacterium]|nr:VOC family protein [Alphaproteobacteria bacterium]